LKSPNIKRRSRTAVFSWPYMGRLVLCLLSAACLIKDGALMHSVVFWCKVISSWRILSPLTAFVTRTLAVAVDVAAWHVPWRLRIRQPRFDSQAEWSLCCILDLANKPSGAYNLGNDMIMLLRVEGRSNHLAHECDGGALEMASHCCSILYYCFGWTLGDLFGNLEFDFCRFGVNFHHRAAHTVRNKASKW
jgi:hypothetical protein